MTPSRCWSTGPSERRAQVLPCGQVIRCSAHVCQFVRADQSVPDETGRCGQADAWRLRQSARVPDVLQVIAAIRTHRLEVAVAGRCRSRVDRAHRLVHQSRRPRRAPRSRPARTAAARPASSSVNHPTNTANRSNTTCSRSVEQHVRPVQRRRQGLLTSGTGSPSARQQTQTFTQPSPTPQRCRASAPGPLPARSPTASRPTAGRSRASPPARRRRRSPARPRRQSLDEQRHRIRLTKSSPLSASIDIGPSAMTCSPRSSSASRLVATILQPRARLQQPVDQPAAERITCSQLSNTNRAVLARGTRPAGPPATDPATACNPNNDAISSTTAPPTTPRRDRRTTRRRRSRCSRTQASITSRVLPIPPTPTTVTSRCFAISSDSTPSSSAARRSCPTEPEGSLRPPSSPQRRELAAPRPATNGSPAPPRRADARRGPRGLLRRGPTRPSRPTARSVHRDPPP